MVGWLGLLVGWLGLLVGWLFVGWLWFFFQLPLNSQSGLVRGVKSPDQGIIWGGFAPLGKRAATRDKRRYWGWIYLKLNDHREMLS